MANALFVDISSWNGASPINWQRYKPWSAQGDGISRILLRDDQGVGVPDSAFETYWRGAVAAGIDEIFVYHYAYPNLHPGDAGAVAEAQSMEQIVGARLRPNDKVMLDLEQNESRAWALAFGQELLKWHPTASKPVLYDSDAHIRQFLQDAQLPAVFDLGLADWTFDPNSRPPCPPPWQSYTWLQFTDRLSVPGMPGTVDANVFLGGTLMAPKSVVYFTFGQGPLVGKGLADVAADLGVTVADLKSIPQNTAFANYDNNPASVAGMVIALPGYPVSDGEPLADAAHSALKAWLGV